MRAGSMEHPVVPWPCARGIGTRMSGIASSADKPARAVARAIQLIHPASPVESRKRRGMYKTLARTPAMHVMFHVRHPRHTRRGGHSLRRLLPCPIRIEMAFGRSCRSNTRKRSAAGIAGYSLGRRAGAGNTATTAPTVCILVTSMLVLPAIAPVRAARP
jgi:hypothetical protein